MFSNLMRDTVDLLKLDGTIVASLRANVTPPRKVTMFPTPGSKLVVDAGDLIKRKLSTGAEEIYRVIEPGFHEAFHGIPPNYQMTVQKLDAATAQAAIASIGEDQISEERRIRLFAQWEEQGVDFIKHDLMNGGFRIVGGPPSTRKLAHAWVQMKEEEQRRAAAEHRVGHMIHLAGHNSRVNINSTDQSTNTVTDSRVFNEIREALDRGVADAAERSKLKELVQEMEVAPDKQGFLRKYQAFVTAAANHITALSPFLPALTDVLKNLT